MDDRSFAGGMPAGLPPMRDLAAAAVCGVCWGLFYRFFPATCRRWLSRTRSGMPWPLSLPPSADRPVALKR